MPHLHGDPPVADNPIRATWAKNALATFTHDVYGGRHPDTMDVEEIDEAIGDLIVDLLHYAVEIGRGRPDRLDRASRLFLEEREQDR